MIHWFDMDPRWVHPFTCVIAGPTGCGKTTFVRQFLDNLKEMTDPVPEEVVWCYGQWQAGYRDLTNVVLKEGIPSASEFQDGKRRLVILDDLMSETDERVTQLFTKGSHHLNLSICHLVQDLFGKNKHQRTISLNSHYLVVFKNPRDASQITHLAKQMHPGQTRYLQEAFKDATSGSYGYLVIDLKQATPEHLRLRTSIFPGETHVVYVQK